MPLFNVHPARSSILLACALFGCGGEEGICDAGDLTAALAAALPGDVIEVGACSVSGHFTISSGVTLRGAGRVRTRLISIANDPVVRMIPAPVTGPATALESLTITSNARFGVYASAFGQAAISDVRVDAATGIAIGLEKLDRAQLDDVEVYGPVIAAAGPTNTASRGLVLIDVTDARINNLQSSGFRVAGASLVRGATTWTGGQVSRNLGHGLIAEGGNVVLADLSISDTISDPGRMRTWGAVFYEGATVSSTRLNASNNNGYGLLHLDLPQVAHDALTANDNIDAAVWLSSVEAADISGEMRGNRFMGLFAHQTANLTVHDTTIADTRAVDRPLESGTVTLGDGIQLVESTTEIDLRDVVLQNNERAGLLLDLGSASASTMDIAISGTRVEVPAIATAYGAVAQNGTVLPGWDTGIMRVGSDAARDSISGLPKAGAVGPCEYPQQLEMTPLDMLVP